MVVVVVSYRMKASFDPRAIPLKSWSEYVCVLVNWSLFTLCSTPLTGK